MKTIICFPVHFADTRIPSVELAFEVDGAVPMAKDGLVFVAGTHAVIDRCVFHPESGNLVVRCWGQFWHDEKKARDFIEDAKKIGWKTD